MQSAFSHARRFLIPLTAALVLAVAAIGVAIAGSGTSAPGTKASLAWNEGHLSWASGNWHHGSGGRWRRLFHDDDDAAQRSAFELPDDDGGPGSDAHLFDDDNHSGPRCAKWSLGNRGWNLDTRGEFPMVLGHR